MLRIVLALACLGSFVYQTCSGDTIHPDDWKRRGFYRPRRNYPSQRQNDNSFQSTYKFQSSNAFSPKLNQFSTRTYNQNSERQNQFQINYNQNSKTQSFFGNNNQPQNTFGSGSQNFKTLGPSKTFFPQTSTETSYRTQNQHSISFTNTQNTQNAFGRYTQNSIKTGYSQISSSQNSRISQNSFASSSSQKPFGNNNGQNAFVSNFVAPQISQKLNRFDSNYNYKTENTFGNIVHGQSSLGNSFQSQNAFRIKNATPSRTFSNFGSNSAFFKDENYSAPNYLPPKRFTAPEYLPPEKPRTTTAKLITTSTTRRPTTTGRTIYTTTRQPSTTTTTTRRPTTGRIIYTTTRQPSTTTTTRRPTTGRTIYTTTRQPSTTTTTRKPTTGRTIYTTTRQSSTTTRRPSTTPTTERPYFTITTTKRPLITTTTTKRALPAGPMVKVVPMEDEDLPPTTTSISIADPASAMPVPIEDEDLPPTTTSIFFVDPASAMPVPSEPVDSGEIDEIFSSTTTKKTDITTSSKTTLTTPPTTTSSMTSPTTTTPTTTTTTPSTTTTTPSTTTTTPSTTTTTPLPTTTTPSTTTTSPLTTTTTPSTTTTTPLTTTTTSSTTTTTPSTTTTTPSITTTTPFITTTSLSTTTTTPSTSTTTPSTTTTLLTTTPSTTPNLNRNLEVTTTPKTETTSYKAPLYLPPTERADLPESVAPADADEVLPEPECDPLDPSTYPYGIDQRSLGSNPCEPPTTTTTIKPPFRGPLYLPPEPKIRVGRSSNSTLKLADLKGTPRPVWYAGIYRKTANPYKPICGGSIIREDIVISAAHCFWVDSLGLQRAELFAVAARKIYKPWNDSMDKRAQKSDVLDIKIPPRFLGAKTSFQEDLAILKLATPFTYSKGLKPICVDFDDDFDRQQMKAGHLGTIAGWGLTAANGTEAVRLLWLELPYVEIEKCIRDSDDSFLKYITCDKVCAGENDTGKALCRGDSGGGLAFWQGEPGHATPYLRGIASTSPTANAECNVYAYASFTHVRAHRTFLKDHVPDIENCRFWG